MLRVVNHSASLYCRISHTLLLCSLLLSTVSSEGTKERTDRVMLTPWVKFLWESHRNILELLKNNNNLQAVYRDVAKDAFKFCLSYERRTEFRKLCDIVSGQTIVCVYGSVFVCACCGIVIHLLFSHVYVAS